EFRDVKNDRRTGRSDGHADLRQLGTESPDDFLLRFGRNVERSCIDLQIAYTGSEHRAHFVSAVGR
ncbi:hypothetical protein, partial [Paraburkholderia sp. SIMBA_054]|uniref:hypothetical protein n=1 Tax=Paraburkholderia sp. SIMBA_054 TaxID=3085795 RepID=UPI00397A9E7B